ncbi:MAG: hypothetical protein ABUL48_06525 [Pseudorhodoplanes sp.]
MRAFSIAVVLIVLLAVIGAFGLGFVQESVSKAFSTSGVQLDHAEALVNNYGRGMSRN